MTYTSFWAPGLKHPKCPKRSFPFFPLSYLQNEKCPPLRWWAPRQQKCSSRSWLTVSPKCYSETFKTRWRLGLNDPSTPLKLDSMIKSETLEKSVKGELWVTKTFLKFPPHFPEWMHTEVHTQTHTHSIFWRDSHSMSVTLVLSYIWPTSAVIRTDWSDMSQSDRS